MVTARSKAGATGPGATRWRRARSACTRLLSQPLGRDVGGGESEECANLLFPIITSAAATSPTVRYYRKWIHKVKQAAEELAPTKARRVQAYCLYSVSFRQIKFSAARE